MGASKAALNQSLKCASIELGRVSRGAKRSVACVALHPGTVYNFGGLLHNPATGLKPETKLSQVQAGNMATVFAVNCTAPMLTLRAFAPLLQAGGAEAEGER